MEHEIKETMRPLMVRVKNKHRVMIKKLAEKKNMQEADVIREAIEQKFIKEA